MLNNHLRVAVSLVSDPKVKLNDFENYLLHFPKKRVLDGFLLLSICQKLLSTKLIVNGLPSFQKI